MAATTEPNSSAKHSHHPNKGSSRSQPVMVQQLTSPASRPGSAGKIKALLRAFFNTVYWIKKPRTKKTQKIQHRNFHDRKGTWSSPVSKA